MNGSSILHLPSSILVFFRHSYDSPDRLGHSPDRLGDPDRRVYDRLFCHAVGADRSARRVDQNAGGVGA
jgi:hypothetical protein